MRQPQKTARRRAMLVVILLLLISASPAPADDDIVFINKNSGTIEGELEADPGSVMCGTCDDQVRLEVDDQKITSQITVSGKSAGIVSGPFQNLKEGRHQALEEVFGADGKPTDASSRLFIVDKTPPELQLVLPLEKKLTAFGITFMVTCADKGAGIAFSDEFISVRLNGQTARWNALKHGDKDALLIDPGEGKGPWESGEEVALSVTVKDRAGNPAEQSWSFSVLPSPPGVGMENVETTCYQRDTKQLITYSGNQWTRFRFPYSQSPVAIVLTLQSMESVAEFGTGELSISGLAGIEQSPGMFHRKPVGESVIADINLASSSPIVKVEKIGLDENQVRFRVLQTEPATRDDMVATLTMQHPEFVDWPRRYDCSRTGELVTIAGEMRAAGGLVTHTIPVILAAENGNIDQTVYHEGKRLHCKLEDTTRNGIALSASYFEVEGMKYWFDQISAHTFIAESPVQEGMIPYRTVLRSATKWIPSGDSRGMLANDNKDWITNGTMTIALDPPQIQNFIYDEQREVLSATISDVGTSIEELLITLSVSGAGELYTVIDPRSGKLEVPYPLPYGIQNASLSASDNAGQTTTRNCRIFGRMPENENLQGHTTSLHNQNPNPASVKLGVPVKKGDQEFTFLSGYGSNGSQKAKVCTEKRMYESVPTSQLNECIARGLPTINNRFYSQIALQQCIRDLDRENAGNKNKRQGNNASGIYYTNLYVATLDCEIGEFDFLAPRIRAVTYHPGSGLITARIDDWGNDTKKLATRFSVSNRRPSEPDWYFWNNNPSVSHTYNPLTEVFRGNFDATEEYCEEYRAAISVTDQASNTNAATLDIVIPKKPPVITLIHAETSGEITQLRATCQDNTGILHSRTSMTIDDRPLQYMRLSEDFSSSRGSAVAKAEYIYGAALDEGTHLAHIKVYDFSGLSAEKSLEFSITNKPEIHRFEALPYDMQRAGGPAFYAFVTDRGEDLTREGIALQVNGTSVDPNRAFYDPSSGYYNIDGPISNLLSTSGSINIATLTATDSHKNSSEKTIRFTWNAQNKVVVPDSETGDLRLEEVSIWETVTRNGDGLLNAAESARIFTLLSSRMPVTAPALKGLLVSLQDTITIESGKVLLGDLVPGETLNPLKGFDIRVAPDFFRNVSEDRRDVDFFLDLEDKGGRSWRLPVLLTVYRGKTEEDATGNAPALSVVRVNLDNTPATTEDTQITITGRATSTLYDIAALTINVDGVPVSADLNPDGRFTAVVPLTVGHNFIEVEAEDTSGITGWASRLIIRTEPALPPEIEILSPADGRRYNCDFNSYNFIDISGIFVPNHSTYTIGIQVQRWKDGVTVINTTIPPSGISGNNFNYRIFLNDLGADWDSGEICASGYGVQIRIETPAGSDSSSVTFHVDEAS